MAEPGRPHWVGLLTVVAITDRSLARDDFDFFDRCERLLSGGVRTILFREKDLSALRQFEMCSRLLPIVRTFRGQLIVADRVDVALAVGADGVQLSAVSLSAAAVRRMVPPGFIVGASCHDGEQLTAAEAGGASYALVSPVFNPTNKDVSNVLGLDGLSYLAKRTTLPVVALGGITPRRAAECLRNRAVGVAAIGGLFGSVEPGASATEFVGALESTR